MKTRKLSVAVLLFIAIALITNVNAQEKQNDATWEETVEFINMQKGKVNYAFKWGKVEDVPLKEFHIEGKVLNSKNEGNCRYGLDLSKLLSAQEINLNENKYPMPMMKLTFTGNYNICEGFDEKFNEVYYAITDVEMRSRVLKAFKHLAFLATQKRLQEQKKQKEKYKF